MSTPARPHGENGRIGCVCKQLVTTHVDIEIVRWRPLEAIVMLTGAKTEGSRCSLKSKKVYVGQEEVVGSNKYRTLTSVRVPC